KGRATIEFGSNSLARYLKQHGRLPSGAYRLCVNAEVKGYEDVMQECDIIESDSDMLLSLIYPVDMDTIETCYPVLQWIHDSGFDLVHQKYRLNLVEIKEGQIVGEAIRLN